jgi:hypothetical protein
MLSLMRNSTSSCFNGHSSPALLCGTGILSHISAAKNHYIAKSKVQLANESGFAIISV